jgi:hypothetical protein
MNHISYSELKEWVHCAFSHKLIRLDKIEGFKGNAFTAFGNAIHNVCEKKLLNEKIEDKEYFLSEFEKYLQKLPEDVEVDPKLVEQMKTQGESLLDKPVIENALKEYFKDGYEVLEAEMELYEPVQGYEDYRFKGYIDGIVATPDGKVHIFDWKTCSWGWDSRRKNDAITTYQLTLYKHFFAQKMGVDPKYIETHFALIKRTAKKNQVEFFRVTSGPKKTENALKLLNKALYNITNKRYIKNRLSCKNCKFRHTEHCP